MTSFQKKLFFPVALLAGIGSAFGYFFLTPKETKSEASPEPIAVKTITIQKNESPLREAVFGAFVRGENQITLYPRISGYIASIQKKEGDTVRKGDILATISVPDASVASKTTQETSRASQQTLDDTKKYYDQKIDEARANLEKIKNDEDNGDATDEDVEVAEESLQSAKRAYDLFVSVAQKESLGAEAQARIADTTLAHSVIRAPFSGILLNRSTQLGELVSPEVPLFSIATDTTLEVFVSLPRMYASVLEIGVPLSLLTENNHQLSGKIVSFSPSLGETMQQIGVRIHIDPKDTTVVRIGDYVRVHFPLTPKETSIFIPQNAIVFVHNEAFVYIAEENKAKRVRVSVGETFEDNVRIIEGLSLGDHVIIEGQHALSDGAPLHKQ